jgi:hypothetical protein
MIMALMCGTVNLTMRKMGDRRENPCQDGSPVAVTAIPVHGVRDSADVSVGVRLRDFRSVGQPR